jgi:hypothetical protein
MPDSWISIRIGSGRYFAAATSGRFAVGIVAVAAAIKPTNNAVAVTAKGITGTSATETCEAAAIGSPIALAHMPPFTPDLTRSQLGGKLAMKPSTIPICIINQ